MSDIRSTVLNRLLGKGKAPKSPLQKAVADLQKALIAEGRTTKSRRSRKAMIEELPAQVAEVFAPVSENIPPEIINETISLVVGATIEQLSAEVPEVDVEADPAATPEEEVDELVSAVDEALADGEEEEDEEEELITAVAQLTKRLKAQARENNDQFKQIEALVELVPSFVAMAAAVSDLAPMIKSAGRIDLLESQLAAINKALSMSPRRASKDGKLATSTEAQDAIDKSTDAYDTQLGIAVHKKRS